MLTRALAARLLRRGLDGRLYLVDWDEVDLSDPWRDAGIQLWWHVPVARWTEFVAA
jgi:hypothetical protein